MKSIDDYSIEELEDIINEKKRVKEIQNIPRPLEEINFRKLIETSSSIINETFEWGYVKGDASHSIYETAMEAIYGKGIWKWLKYYD